jgi:hypothetical protein
MRIPYALQDFKSLRERNFLYVDKTKYIELLENLEDYIMFLRPRRFGKTLFTSMLEYYYDIQYKIEFKTLFDGLYISKNKTENAHCYNVLKFNFSGIITEKTKIEKSFADCIRISLYEFIYTHKLKITIIEDSDQSNTIIRKFLVDYRNACDRKIYLIIDEYDHFANNVLSEDRNYFNQITGKDGFVRTFYEVFKMFAGNTIERFFITGVTPITLDSLTSGFNISKNLGNEPSLNEMIGFTETEVKSLLSKCDLEASQINILRENYNGYKFSDEAISKVYNSNLLMFYLSEYMHRMKLPRKLIDENIISDYSKIENLFDLYKDEIDKKEIIETIVAGNALTGQVKDKVGPLKHKFGNKETESRLGFTRNDFLSLLYYLGLLTISGRSGENIYLTVPNYCISQIYTQFYLSYLYQQLDSEYTMQKEIESAMHYVVTKNDFTIYKHIVENLLRGLANKDFIKFDEKYVQLLMYSIAKYSKMYLVKTEYEVEKGKVADLVLLPNHVSAADYHYVIEIKYIKKSECTKHRLTQERQNAIAQVNTYANSQELKDIPNLKKYVVVAVKDELSIFEEVV